MGKKESGRLHDWHLTGRWIGHRLVRVRIVGLVRDYLRHTTNRNRIIFVGAKSSEETLLEPARLTDMPGANFGGGNIAVFSREN